jgi:proteic killer suppression protein
MIVSFKDEGTRDIFLGHNTRRARKACPQFLWNAAHETLMMLELAEHLDDLREPPGNRLKRLQGDRLGAYSVRVNDQYRVCFGWGAGGAEDVEIVDYH